MQQKNIDILYCDTPFFGDENFTIYKKSYSKFRNIYIRMQPHTTSIFRKTLLNKSGYFREDMNLGEDWDFWARMSSIGANFEYYPKPFFKYRRILDGNSLSQKEIDKTTKVAEQVKSQFNPHREITLEEVNKYILNNFKDNKELFIKLLITILFPFAKRFFKNNIVLSK